MKDAPDSAETADTFAPPATPCPPVETAAGLLEARMEAAGRRVAAYLRHLPMPERSRHELALGTLAKLAENPGDNAGQAEIRAMRILRDLLADRVQTVTALPNPPLTRLHMKPEEMDRRPWVRFSLRLWRPAWNASAAILNTSLMDIPLFMLLLAGLYLLDMPRP